MEARASLIVVVVSPASSEDAVARLARELTETGTDVRVVTGSRELSQVLDAGHADLVHLHGWPGLRAVASSFTASERKRIPLVLTLHEAPARMAALLAASEAVLGWSGRMVLSGVSGMVAAQAARWMPDASVGVLPFGVDLDVWRPLGAPPSGAGVRFASAPRMRRETEGTALLHVFAEAVRFVAGAPDLRLTITGEGAARAGLMKLAAELGIADRVEWTGQRDAIARNALYAKCDAFVESEIHASSAMASLEARAAGLPVIARLSSGARDFISPGVHGLLARDDVELARFIARMAMEEPLRRFIANRNRRERPSYDWATVVAMHLALYEAAVARCAATAPPNQR